MDWSEVLGLHSVDRQRLRYLGYRQMEQGNYRMALTYFEGLTLLDRSSLFDLQMVGALYLQMGDMERALLHLDHALKMDPHHLPTLLNRAKALCLSGRTEEGLLLAALLKESRDEAIASLAEALVLAYGTAS